MSGEQFVHLHVHTEYSMLDGAARLGDLFSEAQRLGQPALAMSDHGNVYGAYDFYKRGKAAGVKPIIGIEGYYAPQGRFERSPFDFGGGYDEGTGEDGESTGKGRQAYTHMTMWAETTEGLHNLFRLSSLSSLEGFYRKPRIDRDLLQTYGKGIIGTTGCPSGEVNRWLQAGNYDRAIAAAADYRDILGKDNYFCELMDHGLGIERRHRDDLLKIARALDIPLLATNDLHYVYPGDAESHDVLLCIGTRTTMDDPKRFRFDGRDFYLKSAEEMRDVWSELPEACDNTLLIAERCNVEFNEGANLMPRFPVPDGENEESWLVKEVERGLALRFPNGVPDTHRAQAEYEVGVIIQMGFPGYFLVTADLVRHAKEAGIRVGPGRGSAAGALIAYALGITELDPIAHGLLFERFLNPERVSMPDIDMDFDERRRGDMIRYATEKYGEERVAQIITYGSIKAKAAIKDSARALGYPFQIGERITKAMPPAVMGKDIPLAGIFDKNHSRYNEASEFRALYEADADVRKVVDTAKGLEGLKRQPGVHAAGVILCSEPLLDVIPIWRATRRSHHHAVRHGRLRDARPAQDGLPRPAQPHRPRRLPAQHRQQPRRDDRARGPRPSTTPRPTSCSRAATPSACSSSTAARCALCCARWQPDNFEDISAVLALYRPGPMGANAHNDYADRKNGRKPVDADPPRAGRAAGAEILGETYGLIVYQEQVMAIAQKLAGYSLGAGRPAAPRDGQEEEGDPRQGVRPLQRRHEGQRLLRGGDLQTLWEILVPFSDYAFNKAHTAGYGLVSYWTAYLKANYPAEYMAALLHLVKDDKDKSAVYLGECRRMGIKVLPPDVNDSDFDYTPRGTDIRFGLSAVRNVGTNVVESLIEARMSKGRFGGFDDFLEKVPISVVNKRVVESLIKAGAFDSLGESRKGLLLVHEQRIDSILDIKRQRGDRPGLPVRRPRRRLLGRHLVAAADPHGRVGQGHAARLRARDARALRLGPPAQRGRARSVGGHRRLDLGGPHRRRQRRQGPRGRRSHHERAAQGHQAGQRLGDRDPRGSRGLDRRHDLPCHLPARRAARRARRSAAREGPRRQERRGGHEGHRDGDLRSRPLHGGVRPGRRHHPRSTLHPARDRALQGGARRSPRRGRGAPRDAERPAHHRRPTRRPAAGLALARALRRPQGAARPVLLAVTPATSC